MIYHPGMMRMNMSERKLRSNSVQCLNCKAVIKSTYRWEFVSCPCKQLHDLLSRTVSVFCQTRNLNALEESTEKELKTISHGLAVDGGLDYLRRVYTRANEIKELSKYEPIKNKKRKVVKGAAEAKTKRPKAV